MPNLPRLSHPWMPRLISRSSRYVHSRYELASGTDRILHINSVHFKATHSILDMASCSPHLHNPEVQTPRNSCDCQSSSVATYPDGLIMSTRESFEPLAAMSQHAEATSPSQDPHALDQGIRKRARRACLSCRARKVRCDVLQNGSSCTNCRLDHRQCIVRHRAARRKSYSTTPRSHAQSENQAASTKSAPSESNSESNSDQLGGFLPSLTDGTIVKGRDQFSEDGAPALPLRRGFKDGEDINDDHFRKGLLMRCCYCTYTNHSA